MKISFLPLVILLFIFTSCGPDEPLEFKFLWEGKNVGLVGQAYCCEKPGDNCLSKTTGFTPTSFRNYVEHDSLSYYFQTQDWQNDIPELIQYPQIVDSIIRFNPKGLFIEDFAFVILRSRSDLAPRTDNVLFAVRTAPGSCKDFFDQF